MFATLTKGLEYAKDKISEKAMLWRAEALLNLAGIKADDVDVEDNAILFKTLNDKTALFMVDTTIGHRLESTIAFDAEASSLKAVSDIANVAFSHKCCTTGLKVSGPGRLRVLIAYHLGSGLSKEAVENGVELLGLCIEEIVENLTLKVDNASKAMIDISMFSEFDAMIFNPRLIGERKEFLYSTWDNYARAVLQNQDELASVETTIDEIMACKEFEEVNDIPLAEIGDVARKELGSHQVNMEMADDLSIN